MRFTKKFVASRLTTNIGRIGGFERDFSEVAWTKIHRFVREFPDVVTEFEKLIFT